MDRDELKGFLEKIRSGQVSVDEGISLLRDLQYLDVGCAKIDTHRESRVGYPEVIFCPGKTTDQFATIVRAMLERESNILATRASQELYDTVRVFCPEAIYHPLAKTITIKKKDLAPPDTYIAIVTAGTSDLPVAEEAAVTAELFGNRVERIVDVGVAGSIGCFTISTGIRGAKVVIAVAGDGRRPSQHHRGAR